MYLLSRINLYKNPRLIKYASLFKSNFGSETKKFLEEDEYIDFSDHHDSKEFIPNQEQFETNFVKMTPLKNSFMNDYEYNLNKSNKTSEISDQIINRMKSKFNFELDPNDPYYQNKAKIQEGKSTQLKSKDESFDENKTINYHRHRRNLFNKDNEKKSKALINQELFKHLEKVEEKIDTPEAMINQPSNKVYQDEFNKIESNLLESNRAITEYIRGEEGVDYVHLEDDFLQDVPKNTFELFNEVYIQKQMGLDKTTDPGDYLNIRKWRDYIEKNQDPLENFDMKEIRFYKGSEKGPRPQDDPEYFANWYLSNMPSHMKQAFASVKLSKLGIKSNKAVQLAKADLRNEVSRGTIEITQGSLIHQSHPSRELPFLDIEEKAFASKNDIIYHSKMEDWETTFPLPDKLAENYHDSQDYIEKWALFRLFPLMPLWMKALNKFFVDLEENKIAAIAPRIPSLYTYYNLLPKFAREHPIVMNVVRGLEWTKAGSTMQEKETMLNYACLFTLPMDPVVEDACKEAVITCKWPVPIEHQNIVLGETPTATGSEVSGGGGYIDPWQHDRKVIFGPTRDKTPEELEKYRQEYLAKVEAGEEWPIPNRLDPYTPEEDPSQILPIQYYDNDDGFWNDYIEWKEREGGTFPVIMHRPYFKH